MGCGGSKPEQPTGAEAVESKPAALKPTSESADPPKAAEPPPKVAEPLPNPAESPPKAAEAPPKAAEAPPKAAEAPPKAAEAPPKAAEAPPKVAEAPPKAAAEPSPSPKAAEPLPQKASEPPPARPAEDSSGTVRKSVAVVAPSAMSRYASTLDKMPSGAYHQILLVPITVATPDSEVTLSKHEATNSMIGGLAGLINIELFRASADMVVVHACFADAAAREVAAPALMESLKVLKDMTTGEPQPLVGKRVWSFIGPGVVQELENESHCRVMTIPINPGTLQLILEFSRSPLVMGILQEFQGIAGLNLGLLGVELCVLERGEIVLCEWWDRAA